MTRFIILLTGFLTRPYIDSPENYTKVGFRWVSMPEKYPRCDSPRTHSSDGVFICLSCSYITKKTALWP